MFNRSWPNRYVFNNNEISLDESIPFNTEKNLREKTVTIIERGVPHCLKCDQQRKEELLRSVSDYREERRKKQTLIEKETEEKRKLNDKLQEEIIKRYFKSFDAETDPIDDEAVLLLKNKIEAIGLDKKLFTDYCKSWQNSQNPEDAYYYKLIEYEYQKYTPIVCRISKEVLDEDKRAFMFFINSEGKEIINPVQSLVYVNNELFEEYSKEVIVSKLNDILNAEKRSLEDPEHMLYRYERIKFGKYRNKTVNWIINNDPDYIDWLKTKGYQIYDK